MILYIFQKLSNIYLLIHPYPSINIVYIDYLSWSQIKKRERERGEKERGIYLFIFICLFV